MATLTGRERVQRMFLRQDQDRIPCSDSCWWETEQRWIKEGLVGGWSQAMEMLGNDFAHITGCWPSVFPGDERIVREDELTKDVRDCQGKTVRYWKNKSGTPEHLAFGCDNREVWERDYKPRLLANPIQINIADGKKQFAAAQASGRWSFLTGVEGFEETGSVMGDEITLIAMAEDPDWVQDVSRTFADVMLANWQAVLDAGIQPDGIWCYGDMAFKHATMCSPAMYKALIWPDHKRMADWAHAHGMKFIYHTDGDVNGVMDLYVQAGFDCLQPLECKASMDIRRLIPGYARHFAFFGNIDVMKMASNDLGLIEEEIRQKFQAGKSTRGYAYHSDHSVPAQVSWQTYQFIIDCVKKYGSYA